LIGANSQAFAWLKTRISNLLNRKRGLSVAGMDRVFSVQHLSVLDLLDPAEINQGRQHLAARR